MRRLLVSLMMVLALSAYPLACPGISPAASALPGKISIDQPTVAPEEVGLATTKKASFSSMIRSPTICRSSPRCRSASRRKTRRRDSLCSKPCPRNAPITIRDLLRHTSGLTYGVFGDTLVDKEYRKTKGVMDGNLASFVTQLARLPLLYEPGTRWNYSLSVDVLGRLTEVLSGKSFEQFLQERIFAPLEMRDTGFHVPAGKKDRLAKLYNTTGVARRARNSGLIRRKI